MKKPIEQITVTEICRLAGVNRSTFYVHFSDAYQQFDNMKQDLILQKRVHLDGYILERTESLHQALSSVLTILVQKKRLVLILIRATDLHFWVDFFQDIYADSFLASVCNKPIESNIRPKYIGFLVGRLSSHHL